MEPTAMQTLFTDMGVVLTQSLGFITTLLSTPVTAIPIYIGLIGLIITFVRRQLPSGSKK